MAKAFLAHGSNALLIVLLLALATLFALGIAHAVWLAALLGAAIFFTTEYTTHRFLFHAPPTSARWLLRLQHRLHYDHHIEPARIDLLFLPPWFVLPVTALYFLAYGLIVRDLGLALSLTAGSLFALLYYEWVHYVAHIPFVPLTAYGRWIKKYHLWHHFKNERLWFGVTNPSMDFVMRTYQPVQDALRSDTVREIWKA